MLAFPEILKSLTPVRSAFKKGSSFRKYTFEKITDLMAIIISIYLALSIEGWAEKRQEHHRLIQYYKNMINEIKEDTASLNTAIKDAEKHMANAEKQLELIKSFKPELNDTITRLMGSMTTGSIFYSSSMITLKSMQMGGDIKLIENIALRDSLIKLEDKYLNLKLHEDLYIKFIENDLLVMLRENFNLLDGSLLDKLYFSKTEYINMVYFFYSLNSTRLSSYREALSKAENTTKMLNHELNYE